MIMERRREFELIFHPRSIAVVGVSAKEMGFGNYFLNSLIQFGLKGKIYPVHPETTEISGLKAYPSVKNIPEPVDAGRPIIPPSEYKQVLEIAAAEPQIDTLIVVQDVCFVGYMGREALQETIEIPTKIDEVREKAILMVLSTSPSAVEMIEVEMEWRRTRDRYLALGIPVYPTIERAAKALANFVNYYERIHKSECTRKKLRVECRS